MDRISKEKRSKIMSSIHSNNTKPELVVRKYLWKLGYRYRINLKRLPGHPDIVLRKYRTCIFVNGCFWHGHQCPEFREPKSNTEFWRNKIARNQERDKIEKIRLAELGWHVIVVWECELKPQNREKFLDSLVYTLNHIFLQDHSVNYKVDSENIELAAEPTPNE
ncbi:MAG: DNA mismatch endonuclease Vsr [Prevotella sp.]|nr:DNA mismatch endonuclease Vsr [Prevotella sp.]